MIERRGSRPIEGTPTPEEKKPRSRNKQRLTTRPLTKSNSTKTDSTVERQSDPLILSKDDVPIDVATLHQLDEIGLQTRIGPVTNDDKFRLATGENSGLKTTEQPRIYEEKPALIFGDYVCGDSSKRRKVSEHSSSYRSQPTSLSLEVKPNSPTQGQEISSPKGEDAVGDSSTKVKRGRGRPRKIRSSLDGQEGGPSLLDRDQAAPPINKYDKDAPRTTRYVNNRIYDCLIQKDRKTPPKKERFGWVYVFEPSNYPNHVKIGKSCSEPTGRRKSLMKCIGPLAEMEDSYRNAFDYHGIVETLLHAEFHNSRKTLNCHCGKTHGEMFEVDKVEALIALNKWRKWILERNPFDDQWKLTGYWAWRARRLPKELDNVNWDRWTQPGILDFVWFRFENFELHYMPAGGFTKLLGTDRKDLRFIVVGTFIVLVSRSFYGVSAAVLAIIGLLLL